jgi:uncharacterized protein (TIGR03435 family)
MTRAILFAAVLYIAAAQPGEFEVASVKPAKGGGVDGGCRGIDSKTAGDIPLGRCVISAGRLSHLISIAWGLPVQQIKGGPDWVMTGFDRYNIESKAEEPSKTTEAQLLAMLQSLLVERFELKFHREPSERPGFALVVGKNGMKVKPAKNNDAFVSFGSDGKPRPGEPATMIARAWSMSRFVEMLNAIAHAPVIDKTGLSGDYDFTLSWDETNGPTLQTAVEEQLGLKLEPQKVPVSLFVIESAQKPSAN